MDDDHAVVLLRVGVGLLRSRVEDLASRPKAWNELNWIPIEFLMLRGGIEKLV